MKTLTKSSEWPEAVRELLATHEHVESPPGSARMLTRYEVIGPTVTLEVSGNAEPASGQVVNVSDAGMAVDLEVALRPGENALVELLGRRFAFRVVWSVQRAAEAFRSGLRLVEAGDEID